MNGKTLVVVQCWAGDIARVNTALEQYVHHGLPVLLLSPEDSQACIEHPLIICRSAGPNAYNDETSVHRYLAQLRALVEYDYDWFLLNESDSFCLSSQLPDFIYEDEEVVWSNYAIPRGWMELNHEPDVEAAMVVHDTAMQAPWFLSHRALERMVSIDEAAWDDCPSYARFIDWWFHTATHRAGLRHEDYGKYGTTWPIVGLWGAACVRPDILGGAIMIHAVKDHEALGAVLEAYSESR